MMKLAMSAAAAGLMRTLLSRAGVDRDRILLSDYRSNDWQSLTMNGERHRISLRIPGPGAPEVADRLGQGLGDAEFTIPGQIVADIVIAERTAASDGAVSMTIEALTIAE